MKAMKLGVETGNFTNYRMSCNNTTPIVGKGATLLMWTDRYAFEVVGVSKNGKEVQVREYNDNIYTDDQLGNTVRTWVFRYGSWYYKRKIIVFTSSANDDYEGLYDDDGELKVVDGITKEKNQYTKINVIFGVRDAYQDPSF